MLTFNLPNLVFFLAFAFFFFCVCVFLFLCVFKISESNVDILPLGYMFLRLSIIFCKVFIMSAIVEVIWYFIGIWIYYSIIVEF